MKLHIPAAIAVLSVAVASVAAPTRASADVSVFELDGLSFLSFDGTRSHAIPAGGTIRFHFRAPEPDGSVPFTIGPADVSLPPIPLGPDTVATYSLATPTSGSLRPEAGAAVLDFPARIQVSVTTPDGAATYVYAIRFTTEHAAASNAAGSLQVAVDGMRLLPDAGAMQLVGAVTNHREGIDAPGSAVYTVLSGRFDRLPPLP